ncbi:MAG: hypothetical protein LBS21_12180 [Clostridiales bacterium]|nr:hypothetical protein [Clostridiales bacterium]
MTKVGVIGARNLINFNGIETAVTYLDEAGTQEEYEPDILVVNGYTDNVLISKWVKKLKKSGVAIINADERELYNFLPGLSCEVLTYGFNPKACVTASSVTEDNGISLQVAVLRSFQSLAGKLILQQEFCVDLAQKDVNIADVLASVVVSLLCADLE